MRVRHLLLLISALAGAPACSSKSEIVQEPPPIRGTRALGEACTRGGADDCADGVCTLGYCRETCTVSGTGLCAPQPRQICLFPPPGNADGPGCRRPEESECSDTKPCPSGLRCALDGSCRVGCQRDADCQPAGAACIQGTCAHELEPYASESWFACGSASYVCLGAVRGECNTTVVGFNALDTCDDAQGCQDAVREGRACTPCVPGVTASTCVGNVFRSCNAQGNFEETTCTGAKPHCSAAAGCFDMDIDPREVTRGEYAAFLTATGTTNPSLDLDACAFNVDLVPSDSWPPAKDALDLPVGGVDWCDAYAYCAFRGRRLCGRVGGESMGELGSGEIRRDPGVSEWMFACSRGGENDYPYGDNYQAATCVGDLGFSGAPEPVGSRPGCKTSLEGAEIFDLSGNVLEWEAGCQVTGNGAELDGCTLRGGGYSSDPDGLRCDSLLSTTRGSRSPLYGIRCCGL